MRLIHFPVNAEREGADWGRVEVREQIQRLSIGDTLVCSLSVASDNKITN